MKILGSSTFFGFLPPIPFSSVVKSDVSMLQSQRNGLKRAPNVFKLLKPTIPSLKLTDQLPVSQNREPDIIHQTTENPLQEPQKPYRELNCDNASHSSQTDVCLTEAGLYNSNQDEVRKAASQLNEEIDNLSEIESVNKEVTHNTAEEILCLQNKIKELEASLEKSKVSQKIFRITAQRSKREKVIYQNFVTELLDSLSKKKVVRVVDGEGTEMQVKWIQNTQNEGEQSSIPQPSSIKETPKERRLKAVIGFQEQTIQQLQHRLACVLKENESSKKENQLDSSEPEPLFTVVHKSMPSTTGISDMHTDDTSEQKNENVTNLNDVIVSNVEESELQACTGDAEATELHDKESAIEEIVPDSAVSPSGDCCEELQSSAPIVSENNIESGSASDTEVVFRADTDIDETERVKVVTFPASPTSVVIRGDKVRFNIVK